MSQDVTGVSASTRLSRGSYFLNLNLRRELLESTARDRELPRDEVKLQTCSAGPYKEDLTCTWRPSGRLDFARARSQVKNSRGFRVPATRVFHGMAQALEDDNNNCVDKGEKCYSLRPRSERKRDDDVDDEAVVTWKKRPKKRSKPKPQPLSKYRRKTANARERSRMREINEAFDSLRRAVPHSTCDQGDKLTKISTLRLAMKYIAALSAALAEPPPPPPQTELNCPPPVCLLPPTPPISDSPLSPPPEISPFTEMTDFDPFASTALDLEDFFFT